MEPKPLINESQASTVLEKKYSEMTYAEIQEAIERTQRMCQDTLRKLERSQENCRQAINDAKETTDKIETMKSEFSNVLNKLAVSITGSFGTNAFSQAGNAQYGVPRTSTPRAVAELLKSKKNIAILTGAGISLASGIPTYRGTGSVSGYTHGGKAYTNEEIARYDFMKSHPEVFWRRYAEFLTLAAQCKPNGAHTAVARLVAHFQHRQKAACTLITQNIDNLHVDAYCDTPGARTAFKTDGNASGDAYGFCPEVIEIHGNVRYMRCDSACTRTLQAYTPTPGVFAPPMCKFCKTSIARPNVLYFDEAYTEEFYRKDTALARVKDMDCIVVIGTTLETGFAANLVNTAVMNGVEIVEVSVQPVIKAGKVHRLTGKAEEVLPALAKEVIA